MLATEMQMVFIIINDITCDLPLACFKYSIYPVAFAFQIEKSISFYCTCQSYTKNFAATIYIAQLIQYYIYKSFCVKPNQVHLYKK